MSQSAAAESAAPASSRRDGRVFTPGFSDGLGVRLLAFDPDTGSSIERLQFKPELGNAAGFERAVRERVAKLKQMHHPSIATVRSVDRLPEEGLVLESKHTAGRRLSELFPQARGPIFALELIRHLTPLVGMLHQNGSDVCHGVLTAEHIVATRDGRLVIVEHVLGSAIASLQWPEARLRSELGLALPPGNTTINPRLDIIQLGFLALSLLLGRRLDPSDYPDKIEQLLIEASPSSRLRSWLDRALQLGQRPFVEAAAAIDSLSELPDAADALATPAKGTPIPTQQDKKSPQASSSAASVPHAQPVAAQSAIRARVAAVDSAPAAAPAEPPVVDKKVERKSAPAATPAAATKPPVVQPAEMAKAAPVDVESPKPVARPKQTRGWMTAALTVVAAVEAVVIVGLFLAKPQAVELQVNAAKILPPTIPAPAVATVEPTASSSKPAESSTPATPPAPDRPTPAVAGGFGGVKVSSPLELQVFENGKLVGSTAGQIAMSDGPHTFEFVNESVGFRTTQNVTVKPGQMSTVTVALPNGRISINAVPWADVLIDGTAAGQTPLANLAIPIGNHEITFRNPGFQEQKQKIVVKAEGLTRVSATLQK